LVNYQFHGVCFASPLGQGERIEVRGPKFSGATIRLNTK
jgi:hypothetical protein